MENNGDFHGLVGLINILVLTFSIIQSYLLLKEVWDFVPDGEQRHLMVEHCWREKDLLRKEVQSIKVMLR